MRGPKCARSIRSNLGYTMTELLVVVAVLGAIGGTVLISVMTYLPAASVRWGAAELQSAVNRGKMLAVSTRQNVCVQLVAGGYRFRQINCGGIVWTGPGTDAAGTMRLANNVTITSAASPIFTPFGTATQTAQFTVTGAGARTTTVTVAATGRVTVP